MVVRDARCLLSDILFEIVVEMDGILRCVIDGVYCFCNVLFDDSCMCLIMGDCVRCAMSDSFSFSCFGAVFNYLTEFGIERSLLLSPSVEPFESGRDRIKVLHLPALTVRNLDVFESASTR